MTHQYSISGMTCTGCQAKVQSLLSTINGVKKVSIDLAKNEASIEMEKHIPTSQLKAAFKDFPKYQIEEKQVTHEMQPAFSDEEKGKSWLATYKPILLIFGYISIVTAAIVFFGNSVTLMHAMDIFMAGFFLTFSFFKFLDLQGFADSYSTYDIIAKKFRPWGFIYAFIEFGLGLAYATHFQPFITNVVTLVVMTISIVGVLQSVLNKRKIKCACLGVVFNLPMSTVTIIEDALMIAMSAVMLFLI